MQNMMVNGEKEVPRKQEGETSFVNYMDASKNYDAARDPLGCDIILGEITRIPPTIHRERADVWFEDF